MDLKTWGQLTTLRTNLLNIANLLIIDQEAERQVLAWDLLQNVKELNNIEKVFQKDSNKAHRLLCQMADDPFIEISSEERSQLNFIQWQLLSQLKSMLISDTHRLLEDKSASREEISSSLMANVYCLNQIEKNCIEELEKTEFPLIDQLCDDAEIKREKKINASF